MSQHFRLYKCLENIAYFGLFIYLFLNMNRLLSAPGSHLVAPPLPPSFDVRVLRLSASSFIVAVSERHHEGVRHST